MSNIETQAISYSIIKDFWQRQSVLSLDADGRRPTARDKFLQDLIEVAISQWLKPNHCLLDVGSGDGGSTLTLAERVKEIIGVDYIAEYVKRATQDAHRRGIYHAKFYENSVLDLSEIRKQLGLFDIVTSIRCLINLGTWDNQRTAITEIARCLKRDGLYICSEHWLEGMDSLDVERKAIGLSEMVRSPYNFLISMQKFEDEVQKYFDIVHYHSLGFYIFMSRVFQPLVVAPESPHHDHPINRVAAELQKARMDRNEFRHVDYAGLYVLRRNSSRI